MQASSIVPESPVSDSSSQSKSQSDSNSVSSSEPSTPTGNGPIHLEEADAEPSTPTDINPFLHDEAYEKACKMYWEKNKILKQEIERMEHLTKTLSSDLDGDQLTALRYFLTQIKNSTNTINNLRWHALEYRYGKSETVPIRNKCAYTEACANSLESLIKIIQFGRPESLADSSIEQLDNYMALMMNLENNTNLLHKIIPVYYIHDRAIEMDKAGRREAMVGGIIAFVPPTVAIFWLLASIALLVQPPTLPILAALTVGTLLGLTVNSIGDNLRLRANLGFFGHSHTAAPGQTAPEKSLRNSHKAISEDTSKAAIRAANRLSCGG